MCARRPLAGEVLKEQAGNELFTAVEEWSLLIEHREEHQHREQRDRHSRRPRNSREQRLMNRTQLSAASALLRPV